MWQKNQMKIQDRGEGNFLEKKLNDLTSMYFYTEYSTTCL